jgi:hypothetical protein
MAARACGGRMLNLQDGALQEALSFDDGSDVKSQISLGEASS